MHRALSANSCDEMAASDTVIVRQAETVEARLWQEEYDWLYALHKSSVNVCPTFRFPDLISAAITLSLARPEGAAQIYHFLGTRLVLRPASQTRRRESVWRPQFELLRDLQRSPANRHPNPNFQLDQLVTACVALARTVDDTGTQLLLQARLNMAERTRQGICHADRHAPASSQDADSHCGSR